MAAVSELQMILDRLTKIRGEKAELLKRVDALTADEQRLDYAVEVILSVVGEVADANKAVMRSEEPSPSARLPMLSIAGADLGSSAFGSLAAQTNRKPLKAAIEEALQLKNGMTSSEVVDMVELSGAGPAKRDSVLSTLSRMAGQGLLRRQGRLYFLIKKGEGSEVGTSEPSGATTSEHGQPTSGA